MWWITPYCTEWQATMTSTCVPCDTSRRRADSSMAKFVTIGYAARFEVAEQMIERVVEAGANLPTQTFANGNLF
jgi:hypothetical protein